MLYKFESLELLHTLPRIFNLTYPLVSIPLEGGAIVILRPCFRVCASLLNRRLDSTVIRRSVCRSEIYNIDRPIIRKRSTRRTEHLFILLFFFQPSFFLWSKFGLFLLFPSAFILFSLITHICSSMPKMTCAGL